ncbi:MAG: phytanoyl-CoA dioxygenase family protein [Chloroflexi bacterium]|nr:phytanoyl-CoA dioxygenase family protein [Chloroflexota bacterium]
MDTLTKPVESTEVDVEFAVDKLRMDGYVILESLLPLHKIVDLRERFETLLAEKIRSEPSNRGSNRYQMFLPFEPPFDDPELYHNPLVMKILDALMGQDLIMTYLASDTPLPGSEYQAVHSDTRLLFPETSFSLPAYGVVLNVPLVDFTEENGPLELWPGGTHLMPGRLDMKKLAPAMESVRLLPRAGSVVLRDLRCWHRGTPNRSTAGRPNLALVYTRPWYRFEQRPLTIPGDVYRALPEPEQRLLRSNEILR